MFFFFGGGVLIFFLVSKFFLFFFCWFVFPPVAGEELRQRVETAFLADCHPFGLLASEDQPKIDESKLLTFWMSLITDHSPTHRPKTARTSATENVTGWCFMTGMSGAP